MRTVHVLVLVAFMLGLLVAVVTLAGLTQPQDVVYGEFALTLAGSGDRHLHCVDSGPGFAAQEPLGRGSCTDKSIRAAATGRLAAGECPLGSGNQRRTDYGRLDCQRDYGVVKIH